MDKEHNVHIARRNFLFSRATNEWNSLPKLIINANIVVELKKLIDSYGIFKVK